MVFQLLAVGLRDLELLDPDFTDRLGYLFPPHVHRFQRRRPAPKNLWLD